MPTKNIVRRLFKGYNRHLICARRLCRPDVSSPSRGRVTGVAVHREEFIQIGKCAAEKKKVASVCSLNDEL